MGENHHCQSRDKILFQLIASPLIVTTYHHISYVNVIWLYAHYNLIIYQFPITIYTFHNLYHLTLNLSVHLPLCLSYSSTSLPSSPSSSPSTSSSTNSVRSVARVFYMTVICNFEIRLPKMLATVHPNFLCWVKSVRSSILCILTSRVPVLVFLIGSNLSVFVNCAVFAIICLLWCIRF